MTMPSGCEEPTPVDSSQFMVALPEEATMRASKSCALCGTNKMV